MGNVPVGHTLMLVMFTHCSLMCWKDRLRDMDFFTLANTCIIFSPSDPLISTMGWETRKWSMYSPLDFLRDKWDIQPHLILYLFQVSIHGENSVCCIWTLFHKLMHPQRRLSEIPRHLLCCFVSLPPFLVFLISHFGLPLSHSSFWLICLRFVSRLYLTLASLSGFEFSWCLLSLPGNCLAVLPSQPRLSKEESDTKVVRGEFSRTIAQGIRFVFGYNLNPEKASNTRIPF